MFCVSKKKKSNKKLSPPKDFSCKYQKLLDIFKNLKVIGLLNLENLKNTLYFKKKTTEISSNLDCPVDSGRPLKAEFPKSLSRFVFAFIASLGGAD